MSADRPSLFASVWKLPNLLTMARVALIPVVCFFLWQDTPFASIFAAAFYGIAAFTDYLDGWLARKQGLESLLGKFLDPLADKLLVMATLVLMVPLGRCPAWMVILLLGRELFISGLRSIASSEGVMISVSTEGKYKTAFQLIGILCLVVHYPYRMELLVGRLDVDFHRLGVAILLLSLVYSLVSAVSYVVGFVRAVRLR